MKRQRMSKAARREQVARAAVVRGRFVKLAASAARGELRRPNYVMHEDLTSEQWEAINEALREFLTDRFSGEVPYDSEESVAYHAEFPLAAARMILSATEAYELAEVFDRLKIDIHPTRWDCDGWSEYRETYAVACVECRGVSFGRPNGISGKPADADWPERCDCGAALPVQHHTDVYGNNGKFWANCSCGWETDNPMAERYAKGAATRHLKRVQVEAEQRERVLVSA